MFDKISGVEWVIIIGVWIAGAVLNGLIAKKKNFRVEETAAASIFFSPALVYLYLLAVPANPLPVEIEESESQETPEGPNG